MTAQQLASLFIGLIAGAVVSYVANQLGERARVRREDRSQWRTRRFEIYGEFSRAAKAYQALLYRRAAHSGNGPDVEPIGEAEAAPLFATQYHRRDEQFELMRIVAPEDVNQAARNWIFQLAELRRMAEAAITDPPAWAAHEAQANAYRDAFHVLVRADLEVPASADRRPWYRRLARE